MAPLSWHVRRTARLHLFQLSPLPLLPYSSASLFVVVMRDVGTEVGFSLFVVVMRDVGTEVGFPAARG